jgi:hypothetical protein
MTSTMKLTGAKTDSPILFNSGIVLLISKTRNRHRHGGAGACGMIVQFSGSCGAMMVNPPPHEAVSYLTARA